MEHRGGGAPEHRRHSPVGYADSARLGESSKQRLCALDRSRPMSAGDSGRQLPVHVEQVVTELISDPTVYEIWLIGSRAQGSASPTSDWDLLVRSEREPEAAPRRHREIDVLWCGPSGSVQVESECDYPTLQFSDFEWEDVGHGRAVYTARKFIEYGYGVGRDTSEPVYSTSKQPAQLIWRRHCA